MIRLYCLMLLGSVLMSAEPGVFKSGDESHEAFLSKFYKQYQIAETEVVFKAIQDKKAVIVALEQEHDESKKQRGRLLCFYIKNIQSSSWRVNTSYGVFEKCIRKYYGTCTESLRYLSNESIICSYVPTSDKMVSPFVPHIVAKKTGESCTISLGYGVVTTLSTGKEELYESVLNIYVCPYQQALDVVFDIQAVGDDTGELDGHSFYGHEVFSVPKGMPRLADDKALAETSFLEYFIGSEREDDFVVRVYAKQEALGPDHYNDIQISRCDEDGVERKECVIKQHDIGAGVSQIVVFDRDKVHSKYSYQRGERKWSLQEEDGCLRIVLSDVWLKGNEISARIVCELVLMNDKGNLMIRQKAHVFPKPSKPGYEEMIEEDISLYPKVDKKHFESKFLGLTFPLAKLLGYPYDRDHKGKK